MARSKLYGKNLIRDSEMNVWARGVVRYSAGILDWSVQEQRVTDVNTRKRLRKQGRSLGPVARSMVSANRH